MLDESGKSIALDLDINDQRVCLITVYGPNEVNPLMACAL
jgi:hypothetical protein